MKSLFFTLVFIVGTSIANAGVMEDVSVLQKQWAQANYSLDGGKQKAAFETLIEQAESFVEANPNSAELLIWRAIIKSSYAGVKGGLGALSLAKAARADLEQALKLDENALSGSAYTSLGTLYYKVPGWPLGFGDDDKAKVLLEKALAINPNGIDSNYFYGQFLAEHKDFAQAEQYLMKAQNAPARPNRPLADEGRQKEITNALNIVRYQLKNQ